MLKAWSQLGGIISVSEAVAGYLREWWPRPGLSMPPVHVVHLSAFGCFGHGPFQDFGPSALKQLEQCCTPAYTTLANKPMPTGQDTPTKPTEAGTLADKLIAPANKTIPTRHGTQAQLAGAETAQQQQSQSAQQAGSCTEHRSAQPAPLPVLGVLKLTPEKGCSIVLALARHLRGCFNFLVVAGDPKVAEVLSPQPNVSVIEPQDDIGKVLSRVCLVLAPSLWFESWGMVVTEAMLRGLPCIISNAGGLPEAGLNVCPVCPVAPIEIPTDSEGTPIWTLRQYPKQDIGPWVMAIQQATQPNIFADLSRRCRQAACSFLMQGAQSELPGLLGWLQSLSG
ncbi:hypothetical protein DUNSADRAFT_8692 [Dunaliella salina]|uniref:Glycosyl transferase family 1 domain-containing protein n=1 Tax=Dunaliella salina TaxID=3046 RepID=A0ABQ7GJ26_DUNSA|nr:hypothetical protein DUNSADRAFT_8692 [Dunaliella salina]|eukprot:KAF5834608.1 hypothetical protein DUNSADRAFT_8692 [Dunaliella salina]